MAESARMVDSEMPSNPFPGLRPFEFHESLLYFGRDGQSEQVIRRLGATRFVAVVGTSGSGKSSLVRAGLLPTLYGGFMASAGSEWRVAIMRPGNDPIGNLAAALNETEVLGSGEEDAQTRAAIIEASLRRGSLGLVEAVRQARMSPNENLLVVADQFEELFRYARVTEDRQYQNDAAAFVKLLLEASRQREVPIFVVLTMRSDFLGDCAIFWELPEAINEGQYLIPRLTREQRREAIAGPIAVCGGQVTPRLVNRLLNDMGDNPDQLPILQHALMRTWNNWKENHKDGEPIDLQHYEAIGTMAEALSRHADEAYNELGEGRGREIAERLFKGLTEKGGDNREVRRPLELAQLCALTDGSEPDVKSVIEVFRREERSFLMPPAGTPLEADSLIDISHESLIRNWERLKKWVEDEARSARIYRRVAETAGLHQKGEAALFRDPELGLALKWREETKPNETWARRYHPSYARAIKFLDDSKRAFDLEAEEKEAQRRKNQRRTRIFIGVLVIGILMTAALAVFINGLKEEAREKQELNRALRYAADIKRAYERYTRGDIMGAQDLLEDLLEVNQQPRFMWRYLSHLCRKGMDTLAGHEKSVTSVAFSSGGDLLATASLDGTVMIWGVPPPVTSRRPNGQGGAAAPDDPAVDMNIDRGELGLFTLNVNAGPVWQVAFSPDSKTVVTVSGDNTVKLWDVSARRDLGVTFNTAADFVTSAAFSPDGKTLALCGSNAKVELWDIAAGTGPRMVSALDGAAAAFAPGQKTLAVIELEKEPGTLKVFDVTNRERPRLKAQKELFGQGDAKVAVSPSGDVVAIARASGHVLLWDINKPFEAPESLFEDRPHALAAPSLAFLPDGKSLAASTGDWMVRVWDIYSHELVRECEHKEPVSSVAISPDGRLLVSGSWDATARVWNLDAQPFELKFNDQHPGPGITSIGFSPDGSTLATAAASDGGVNLHDAVTIKLKKELEGHIGGVRAVVFSPDGKTIATASEDTTVKLWDAASFEMLASRGDHRHYVKCAAFSFDSSRLATGDAAGAVLLWDMSDRANPSPLAKLDVDTDMVWSLAFSPDGRVLATGSWDRTVKLWDTSSYKLIATLTNHTQPVTAVAFSPDQTVLATGSWDRTVKLWDARTHELLATLYGHTGPVKALAFAYDGKTIASGDASGQVKLWEVASRREQATFDAHDKAVASVAFTKDGQVLATGSTEGEIKLWAAPLGDKGVGSRIEMAGAQPRASGQQAQAGARWVKSRQGQPVPDNALRGGESHEGVPLYVCRVKHNGDFLAGKTVGGACNVAVGDREVVFKQYEALSGTVGIWRDAEADTRSDLERINAGADDAKPVGVCRARLAGGVHTGTVAAGRCNFGWGGNAQQADDYEVLYIKR